MSWTGTVQCGHCYSEGHNRRGCPQLKQYIKDNPDSYEARMSSMRKSTYTTRACSYCKEPGHTRRTCAGMKMHKAEWVEHNRKWCRRMDDVLREQGIGFGTLIQTTDSIWLHDESRYVNMPVLSVIRGFDLVRMNFECSQRPSDSYALETYPVQDMMNHGAMRMKIIPHHPVLNDIPEFYQKRSEMSVVGPVDCSNANPLGSADYHDWLQGRLGVDELFKERNQWNYPSEGYNSYCNLRDV